jgi:PAS domain S-box-containing protein
MNAVERPQGELGALFNAAFTESRNAMALLDEQRRHVDVNGAYVTLLRYPRSALIGRPVYELVVGGPTLSQQEWREALVGGRFTGESQAKCADGEIIGVQWAATPEVITGRRLVLFVALSTSRWGATFRRAQEEQRAHSPLTRREREIVRLVARGGTAREIAEELHIAHDTVRTHARNAMVKTGARSRAHLVAKALAEGLTLE